MKNLKIILQVMILGCFANTANATLIGDTVNFQREYQGTVFVNETFVVTNGIEKPLLENCYGIDVGDTYLRIDPLCNGQYGPDPHNMTFSNLDILFSGVSFSSANILNVDMSDVTFGTDWVNLSIGNLYAQSDGTSWIQLDLTTDAVPEPSIIALMGAGLAGFGFARRRKQQA